MSADSRYGLGGSETGSGGLKSGASAAISRSSRKFLLFLDWHADHSNPIAVARQGATDGNQGVGLTARTSHSRVPDRFAIATQVGFGEIHESGFPPSFVHGTTPGCQNNDDASRTLRCPRVMEKLSVIPQR